MAKDILQEHSTVKEFRKQVDGKLRDSQALDEANRQKQAALEKQIEAQEKTLIDEQAILERMKADFRKFAESRKGELLAAQRVAEEKLKKEFSAGRIPFDKHLAALSELKVKTAEGIEAIEKEMAEGLPLIKAKHRHVLELERDILSMKLDFFYFESAAPEMGLKDIELLLKTLSARREGAAMGGMMTRAALERVQDSLGRADGRCLNSGHSFAGLTVDQVRDLRFLASIPVKYGVELEKMIALIEANEIDRLQGGRTPGSYTCEIHYRIGDGVNDFSLDWRCENPSAWAVIMGGGRKEINTKAVTMGTLPAKV